MATSSLKFLHHSQWPKDKDARKEDKEKKLLEQIWDVAMRSFCTHRIPAL